MPPLTRLRRLPLRHTLMRNGLTTSLFEHRVALLIAKDRIDMEPECRQVAAVHWSERINGIRFNAHWLWIDGLIVQQRCDKSVRARFTVELWIDRMGVARDWSRKLTYRRKHAQRSEYRLFYRGSAKMVCHVRLRGTGIFCRPIPRPIAGSPTT
jgi:hypothetical protein